MENNKTILQLSQEVIVDGKINVDVDKYIHLLGKALNLTNRPEGFSNEEVLSVRLSNLSQDLRRGGITANQTLLEMNMLITYFELIDLQQHIK